MEISGDPTYTLICDRCQKTFPSEEAFPKPQLCPECCLDKQPDLLLTANEEVRLHLGWGQLDPDTRISWRDYWLKAQLAKAQPILEKRERERIQKELGKYGIWFEHYDKRNEYQGNFIRISEAVYEALKEGKG